MSLDSVEDCPAQSTFVGVRHPHPTVGSFESLAFGVYVPNEFPFLIEPMKAWKKWSPIQTEHFRGVHLLHLEWRSTIHLPLGLTYRERGSHRLVMNVLIAERTLPDCPASSMR